MFSYTVKPQINEAMRFLTDVEARQLPFATALSLTRTAKAAEGVHKKTMQRVFDRPRQFTINSIAVRPATKRELVAEVFFREFAGKGVAGGKYLLAEVHGGPRRPKRSEIRLRAAGIMRGDEFLVPALGFPLDSHGNVPAGILNKMLSQLRVHHDAGSNETARSRKRRLRQVAGHYFMAGGDGRLPRGIYERHGARAVRAVLLFVRQPRYEVRYPFYAITHREAERRFPAEFARAMRDALRSARR